MKARFKAALQPIYPETLPNTKPWYEVCGNLSKSNEEQEVVEIILINLVLDAIEPFS